MIAIAHFARSKALVQVSGGFVVLVFLLVETLHHPGMPLVQYWRSRGEHWIPLLILALFAGLVLFVWLLLVLRQLLLRGSVALWTENERVIYLATMFLSLRRADIIEIRLGEWGMWKRTGIVFTLRSGRTRIVPTAALVEAPLAVVTCLNSWLCNCPPTPLSCTSPRP